MSGRPWANIPQISNTLAPCYSFWISIFFLSIFLPLQNTHTHTHTPPLSLFLSFTHSPTHPHPHPHPHTHTCTHTHTIIIMSPIFPQLYRGICYCVQQRLPRIRSGRELYRNKSERHSLISLSPLSPSLNLRIPFVHSLHNAHFKTCPQVKGSAASCNNNSETLANCSNGSVRVWDTVRSSCNPPLPSRAKAHTIYIPISLAYTKYQIRTAARSVAIPLTYPSTTLVQKVDYTIPAQENNAFFLITNFVETAGQSQSPNGVDEDPLASRRGTNKVCESEIMYRCKLASRVDYWGSCYRCSIASYLLIFLNFYWLSIVIVLVLRLGVGMHE